MPKEPISEDQLLESLDRAIKACADRAQGAIEDRVPNSAGAANSYAQAALAFAQAARERRGL